ncbi:MAG: hypothetical protein RJA70_1039 [Pseudomonadota bacterium]|jgi:hypothetical protein
MPQARTANDEQIRLVTQLLGTSTGQNSVHISAYDSALTVPSFMTAVMSVNSAAAAAEKMVDLTSRLSTPKVDAESRFNCDQTFKRVQSWASGNAPPFYRSDSTTQLWLSDLFTEVAHRAGHVLNRADLFHCHLCYDGTDGDLVMIFHAKEYPSDIEFFKHTAAASLDNSVVAFTTATANFSNRNSIFSVRNNRIYVPHFANATNPYRGLLGDPVLKDNNPLFLDATILGDCIADINAFPVEGVAPFFKIWSPKATRPKCSRCETQHAEGSSTPLGRWHYCGQCNVFFCNICGKWHLKRNVYLSRTRACPTCQTETSLVD